ncbi:hypothetical protein LEP1GSC034_0313 [Leptospira interrogans str. 2003000735]|nr:hypothetical protein LEP1GSC034_0313 [Leptospira interrogans str. 2003000735]EMJ80395.1 hypothetical protein LEP1GSC032_3378 [Leptospira interrogans str. 2002000631]
MILKIIYITTTQNDKTEIEFNSLHFNNRVVESGKDSIERFQKTEMEDSFLNNSNFVNLV